MSLPTIIVDGIVILRIMKHQVNQTGRISGTLLGLDAGENVEITHSFQSCRSEEEEERMIQLLKKEANVDSLVVGQYISTNLGDFYTKDNVEFQAQHQVHSPHSVFLVFDNVPTFQGVLSLKALRLTNVFMEEWCSRDRLGSETFTRLAPSQVFEELPIRVRNPYLVHAFLADVLSSKSLISASAPSVSRSIPSGLGGGERGAPSTLSVAASVGAALGASHAEVAAAELESDFARLDLGTSEHMFAQLLFFCHHPYRFSHVYTFLTSHHTLCQALT